MAEVPSRQLRNDTRGVLRLVEQGEDVSITVDGRPVATLRPIAAGTRWMSRSAFVRLFGAAAAGPAPPGVVPPRAGAELRADLRELLGSETTDDLAW